MSEAGILSARVAGAWRGIVGSERAPLLLHVFPTFAVGGAQVRFCAVANHFGPRWRHIVVALDGQTECGERLRSDVPVAFVSPPRKGGRLRIAALLRTLRPDVLVTSNWGSMDWVMARALIPGLPHLHMEDGFSSDESGGQKPRRVMVRRLLLRRSTILLPSETLLHAAREVWKLPSGCLHHVPNGLDLRRFRPDGPAATLDVPGRGPLLGTVAALRPEKNLARLLRAAAILLREGTPLRLVLIGDGPERGALAALAADLGIADRVRFPGAMPDPASAYRALDAFALSSDTEQMPFSVLEAMASGLPVAATDVGDVRAMVSEANRPFLSSVGGDAAALADALRPILCDTALRHRLGAANRTRAVAAYDEEAMFAAHARLLDGLAARR